MNRLVTRLIGAALITVGTGAVITPRRLGFVFGLPSEDATAHAFMRAAGGRDAIFGALVLTTPHDSPGIRNLVLWTATIGLFDGLLLAAMRGPRPQHVLHLGGFAALTLLALFSDK
jgi:Domain of unknown function (DUF4267)